MKARGRNDTALVKFTGKVQRIAQVHQFGLKDRPNRHAQDEQYPERQLFGFSGEDKNLIEKTILKYVQKIS